MHLFLLVVVFIPLILCYEDECRRLDESLADCYSIAVWREAIPPMYDGDCEETDNSLLYKTELIEKGQSDTITLVFGVVVLGLNSTTNETMRDYCREYLATNVTVSMYVGRGFEPNDTMSVASLTDISVLNFDSDDLYSMSMADLNLKPMDVWLLGRQIKKARLAKVLTVPEGIHEYFVRLVLERPDELPYSHCHAEIMLYSCWVNNLVYKALIGAGAGAAAAFIVIFVPASILICLCCAKCHRLKKRRRNAGQ